MHPSLLEVYDPPISAGRTPENEYGIIKSQISYLGTFNSSEAIAEAYSSCLDTNLTSTIKKLVEKKWR